MDVVVLVGDSCNEQEEVLREMSSILLNWMQDGGAGSAGS